MENSTILVILATFFASSVLHADAARCTSVATAYADDEVENTEHWSRKDFFRRPLGQPTRQPVMEPYRKPEQEPKRQRDEKQEQRRTVG